MSRSQFRGPHWIVATDRMDDLLKEVGRQRLIQRARPERPGLLDRVLAGIGGLLISTGERLQARCTPATYPAPEVCCADY